MRELRKDFSERELIYWKILMWTFGINGLTLLLLFFLQGDIPFMLLFVPLILGIYHIVSFFIYIYRIFIYYDSKDKEGIKIWRSITGIALSPIGLMFSFFNYMIIVLSNVWGS